MCRSFSWSTGRSLYEGQARARASHIFEKEKRGHYVEPAWCSRRLFEVEEFQAPIYDPACGWCTILGEALLTCGYTVMGSDIVDRGNKWGLRCLRRDFLKWRGKIDGSVVCNPPVYSCPRVL